MYNFIFCLDYEFNTYLCVLLFKYYIYVIITAHLYRREFTYKILFSPVIPCIFILECASLRTVLTSRQNKVTREG